MQVFSFFKSSKFRLFFIPCYVFLSLALAFIWQLGGGSQQFTMGILLTGISLGSMQLMRDTVESLREKSFALDYIAILAILTGLFTGNFYVAGVIVLMMSGGNTLEEYAQELAKKSLTALSDRIPHEVVVIDKTGVEQKMPIRSVPIGSTIVVRKGEVIPLDGVNLSLEALLDESSLTGEADPVEKRAGNIVQSGTVNIGEVMQFRNTVRDENSTYRKIVDLVEKAQSEKTPFLQLADRLSGWFTLVTLILAGFSFAISGDVNRVLAVLVIATPCPLILATPIALIGGMNSAARERIIFKRLSALEVLSRVKVMIFDKTGTLTFGVPQLLQIDVKNKKFTESEILSIAAGIEKGSLHPFAKAIVQAAEDKKVKPESFDRIAEIIGQGISGYRKSSEYRLVKGATSGQVVLEKDTREIAHFEFSDVLKPGSTNVLRQLQNEGIELALFTGDSQERTSKVLSNFPDDIHIETDMQPTDKQKGIEKFQQKKQAVAMIGDGINDAPALALADVGIAFSHDEHTASSEAADVILLAGNIKGVLRARKISHRTLVIAEQSMYVGLGLSLVGMLYALTGNLPPIYGALTQELIDVAVILNALRAAYGGR